MTLYCKNAIDEMREVNGKNLEIMKKATDINGDDNLVSSLVKNHLDDADHSQIGDDDDGQEMDFMNKKNELLKNINEIATKKYKT